MVKVLQYFTKIQRKMDQEQFLMQNQHHQDLLVINKNHQDHNHHFICGARVYFIKLQKKMANNNVY
jgi:hypothetical protein